MGRFVRRGPQGKRLQPRARVPALERLSHTSWRQVVDHHGIGPLCDHSLAARRILTPTNSEKRRRIKRRRPEQKGPPLGAALVFDINQSATLHSRYTVSTLHCLSDEAPPRGI